MHSIREMLECPSGGTTVRSPCFTESLFSENLGDNLLGMRGRGSGGTGRTEVREFLKFLNQSSGCVPLDTAT